MTLPSYAMSQASFPEMYERSLVGPLFRPWATLTFDEIKLSKGDRVLDVACGTGIVARIAKERLGDAGAHDPLRGRFNIPSTEHDGIGGHECCRQGHGG
jgi:hypothetical protein